MASAVLLDVLTHSCANEQVLEAIKGQVGQGALASRIDLDACIDGLTKGRALWADVRTAWDILQDFSACSFSDEELRRMHARSGPRTLRALVEHPSLPTDLLTTLAQTQGGAFAREIRSIAGRRLTGQHVPLSDFAAKCAALLTRGLP